MKQAPIDQLKEILAKHDDQPQVKKDILAAVDVVIKHTEEILAVLAIRARRSAAEVPTNAF